VPTSVTKADRLLKSTRIIIPVGFGLVLVAILAVVFGLIRSRDADQLVLHTMEVQKNAQEVLIAVRDAEATKRTYLLTGQPDYQEAFETAMTRVPLTLDDLSKRTMDNPAQQVRIARLTQLIDEKMNELRLTHQMNADGRRDEAIAIINSLESRDLTSDVRNEIGAILETERRLLNDRQRYATATRYLLAALVGAAILAAALLTVLLALAMRKALQRLVERTRELEHESKLRLDAEHTLRQAQKMEAVGQLTGGIAHDFNNLLTIIIGNLDTIKRAFASAAEGSAIALAEKLKRPLGAALQGAASAGQLTHRLLAFSRRQALAPARIDVNKLISGMLDMLSRTLGADVSIETVFGAGLWPTFADPHQLESALLNLALNAKSAMPDGGCLTIETANTFLDENYVRRFGDVAPGQYVVLCVTDTGTGIPKQILDRVFEPFFTTKGTGEGSGLGLAMVHGFVKQSGGHVRIYSEEGDGTTVKIYLPRLLTDEVAATPAALPADESAAPRARQGETILVVEDNEGVRHYAKEVLEELGYLVLSAEDATEALKLFATAPRIDLLFTDVVLPGSMTGRGLAEEIRRRRPDLPALFTTGYTRNAIVHQGRLDPDVHLLNKPYTHQDLARKVRMLLDASKAPADETV
jgi:signal transduction histidine kinase/ActR/RegA family two-component response regulator